MNDKIMGKIATSSMSGVERLSLKICALAQHNAFDMRTFAVTQGDAKAGGVWLICKWNARPQSLIK